MTGILSPHSLLRRGGITRTTRVLARSGAITRDAGEDPLADIPTTLRLQSHRGEVDGTIRYFQATGAGSAGVNQRYSATGVTNGRPHYDAPNGSFLYWEPGFGATGAWRITISDGTEDYFSEGDNPLPPVSGWGNGSGTSPAPSVTRLELPRIKPLGLYKDTACTIPATHDGDAIAAWRDELSGSGLVAVQGDSAKRPILQFVAGRPVVRFDGVDDVLHTDTPAPAGAFSYASSGRLRGTGTYPALIGAPSGGVTFGAGNGNNDVGINRLGTNDPQTPVNVGTAPFAFMVTCGPDVYSYHVRRPSVPDVIISDAVDGSGGYASMGNLMIGNGHNGEIPAPVDFTSILIQIGSRWASEEMARAAAHLGSLNPDPIAHVPLSLRLQTHLGDGVPLGLYKDTACTIPALLDGDPVAAWRDELSGSGLVAVQGLPTKRPVLRLSEGGPQVEFDGVDDFLAVDLPRPFPFSMALGAKSSNEEFGGMASYGVFNVAIGNYYHGLPPDHAFWIWSPERSAGYGEENSLDGDWHVHVGLIPDGNADKASWRMYLDGLQTGSPGLPAGGPILDTATILHLGQDGYGTYWSGQMASYLQGNEIWSTGDVGLTSEHLTSLHR